MLNSVRRWQQKFYSSGTVNLLLKRLDDRDLIAFIDLFKEPSTQLKDLLKELITSSRSDIVWRKAAGQLYAFAQLPMPDPYDHRVTLATFAGIPLPPQAAAPTPVPTAAPSCNSCKKRRDEAYDRPR